MVNSTRWTIRPAARKDLTGIWRDGTKQWDRVHADHYTDALFAIFDRLAVFPELTAERSEFTPDVRIHPIGAHVVIYRPAGRGVEIIRVLLVRQDLAALLFDG